MNKKTETSMIREFLLWTFGIAWGSELILIAGKYLSILTGTLGVAVQYLVIGFGAGAAPAYACYIVYRKRGKIKGLKDFMGLIFRVTSLKKTALVMAVAAFSQLLLCLMFEDYLGGPWYLFILYIPLMIVGGGTEEVGWRGFLQPHLEKKFPFTAAAFIEGLIWAVWHLPLWFVPGSSQAAMNFFSFACYCMALGFVLAACYRLTKCIFAGVLLHAWGNVTFGGMYTLQNLNNPPRVGIIIFYAAEILLSIVIVYITERRKLASARTR